jgi:hypothetical protein
MAEREEAIGFGEVAPPPTPAECAEMLEREAGELWGWVGRLNDDGPGWPMCCRPILVKAQILMHSSALWLAVDRLPGSARREVDRYLDAELRKLALKPPPARGRAA